MKRLIYFLLLSFFCACQVDSKQNNLVVETKCGFVNGFVSQGDSIATYLGIPYAYTARWQAPQSTGRWHDTLNCCEYGACAWQSAPSVNHCWTLEYQIPKDSPMSENCLYLNIWKPLFYNTSDTLPVLVWIHGGAFVSGSGSLPLYNGANLARKGLIVVTINYRLGILGFFNHPDLEGDGNYGLLDQIAALKWVKENIGCFGGDSNSITICGQSAGAYSVSALMVSPLAKDLFNKAILQSGGMVSENPMLSQSISVSKEYGYNFCKKYNLSLDVLKSLSPDSLIKLPFYQGITYGGEVVANVNQCFKDGKLNCNSILCGYNETDGCNFDENISDTTKIFNRLYGFGLENFLEAKYVSSVGNAYMYFFKRVPPGDEKWGAYHSAELGYMFNNLCYIDRKFEEIDYHLASIMSDYWSNFVKYGNPNSNNLEYWPNFDLDNKKLLVLDSVISDSYFEDYNYLAK